MTTRFNARMVPRFGVSGVPSGYDGMKGADGFTIPSCGIEDIDRALFSLFNTEIPLAVNAKSGTTRAPVILASGEKWAMLKKGRDLRDTNDSLILPLVTILKGDITQAPSDLIGRGTNQHTGEFIIKRRLDSRDRGYQALVNKALVMNGLNVAVGENEGPIDGQLVTSRTTGELTNDPTFESGGWLASDLKNNVFEILSIPTPQFMTLNYEITLWTQYHQQMNELIEGIVSSYLPQTRGWRIETNSGYWFVATVSSDEFKSGDNADDMSKSERVIKRTFSVSVRCFILASSAPGVPIPIKRYVSNPVVSFGVSISEGGAEDVINSSDTVVEPFLGADDPTLPLAKMSRRRDGRNTDGTQLYPGVSGVVDSDPALANMPRGKKRSKWARVVLQDSRGGRVVKLVRIKSRNANTGEMVLDGTDFSLGGLTIVSVDD